MTSRREDDTQGMLHYLACVETFESTDVVSFRHNLKECCRKRVLPAVSNDKTLRQHMNGIPWSQLCKAHDKLGRDRVHSSALEEVLCIICNSSVIPSAYSADVFRCLLAVILAKPEKGAWRSSELYILDSMELIAKTAPALSILPCVDIDQADDLELRLDSSIGVKGLDADRLHTYLMVLSELSRRSGDLWFRCACLPLYLNMAKTLDDADIELLKQPYKLPSVDGTMCLHCQKRIIPLTMPPVRRRGASLLRLLDDEGVVEERGKPPVGSVSNGEECRCTHADQQPLAKASEFTQLPFKLVTLRSGAYEAILETLSLVRVHRSTSSIVLRQRRLRLGPANVIDRILDLACQYPHSPSLRLSLMLVADSVGPEGFAFATRRLWKRFDRGGNTDGVLRVWSELIVESSHFDNPHGCWNGLEPLFTRILYYCSHDVDETVQLGAKAHRLLRSLSFVLSRRRPTLNANDPRMNEQFHDFVTRVSVSFGELKFWVTSGMESDEIESIILTLQNVGILGLQCRDERGSAHELSDWPFSQHRGVREAHRRMGPRVSRNQLLSVPDNVNEQQRLAQLRESESRKPKVEPVVLPILNYLNDDIFRTIFSFLGHVDLVRVGSLSKVFRSLTSDDVQWTTVYRCTFGILGHEIEKTITKIGSWRNLFVEKYYSEKALKFKYSSSGWKYRTCGYIGCYQVMRSAEQQAKHHRVHEERHFKKMAREEARLRKKAESECKKRDANEKKRIRDALKNLEGKELTTKRKKPRISKKATTKRTDPGSLTTP